MIEDPATVSHATPVVDQGEPQHSTDGFCWCQPTYEDVPPEGRVYVHRRTLDSLHIEDKGPT